MDKCKVHFIGFLANVDDSITGLQIGDGFTVEGKTESEAMPFLRNIDFYSVVQARLGMSHGGCHCVVKPDIDEFETTPQGGVVIRPDVLQHAHSLVSHKCRLLRLFKEGNILLAQSFLYHLVNGEAKSFSVIRQRLILDSSLFALTTDEISAAELFLRNVGLPFSEPSLQLAFESFDQSYDNQDPRLAFLSLMISVEAMLGPEAPNEITHQISRNAAVLLGETKAESQQIFADMKALYAKRSHIIHGGTSKKPKYRLSREDVLRLREYIRRAIKEIRRFNKSRDELLTLLNTCGFGQRPWRGSSGSP